MKLAFYPESVRPIQHILAIGAGKITFGKAEVIYGVEEICLPDTILTADSSDSGIEVKPGLPVILKLVE